MKLEKQVCTLEQAKRLNELGISGDTMLCIELHPYSKSQKTVPNKDVFHYERAWADYFYTPTFTVAELGVMLPGELRHLVGAPDMLTTIPPNEGTEYNWGVAYIPLGNSIQDECEHYCDGATEAQARAAMLIYLLENGHTTAEEVNKRLQTA